MEPNQETPLQTVHLQPERASPLDNYFQIAFEIKREISELRSLFDRLTRLQERFLRPAFADPADHFREISELTSTIGSRMRSVSQQINGLQLPPGNPPDWVQIVANVRSTLSSSYRTFSNGFQISEQAFSVNLHKKLTKEPPPIEVSFLDLENPGSEQRQLQIEQERNAREIQEIVRRSEAIRDLFLDLENLVIEQGTLVDRIDATLQSTLENARKAHNDVGSATRYQGKSRMWICVVLLILLILILFVCVLLKMNDFWCMCSPR
jgi:syntaxin 16